VFPSVCSSPRKPSGDGSDASGNCRDGYGQVTAADNTDDKWQYSIAANVWIDVGAVGANSALLLADTAKIRFVPTSGFVGQATLTFKAWDRSAGQAGDRIDMTAGLNSFSSDVEMATIPVTP
jgi:hypothetical protein